MPSSWGSWGQKKLHCFIFFTSCHRTCAGLMVAIFSPVVIEPGYIIGRGTAHITNWPTSVSRTHNLPISKSGTCSTIVHRTLAFTSHLSSKISIISWTHIFSSTKMVLQSPFWTKTLTKSCKIEHWAVRWGTQCIIRWGDTVHHWHDNGKCVYQKKQTGDQQKTGSSCQASSLSLLWNGASEIQS